MCRSCAVNIYDVFPDRLGDVTRDPVDDMITNREMGWDLRGYKGHYSDSLKCMGVCCACYTLMFLHGQCFSVNFLLCLDVERVSTCAACLNVIRDDEHLEALNKGWHVDCFRFGTCC